MSTRPTVLAVVLGLAVGTLAVQHGYGLEVGMASLSALGLVQLTDDRRTRAAWRIREALRRADIGIRKAALHMEMDPSDLERALGGIRKLDLWRLEMLPDTFWQEYWPLLAEDKGVPALFSTFLKISALQKESV